MSVYVVPELTVAMRLAADGVKPGVVERCTRYSVTPRSSVDGFQLRATLSPFTVAVGPPGWLGGEVSAEAALTVSSDATLGTPFFSTNSMYRPGGATFGLAGASTLSVPAVPPWRKVSGM